MSCKLEVQNVRNFRVRIVVLNVVRKSFQLTDNISLL